MPKYNLVHSGGSSLGFMADFAEAAAAETAAEEAEALALEGNNTVPDWEYSATAENPGSTGEMDGQPGVIYKGEVTRPCMVNVRGLVLSAGTIAPEAADSIVAGVFKNGTLVATLDNETVANEYVIDELDAETATMEVATIVDAVSTNDVIRIGLLGLGEETVDTDVAVGGAFSIK